MPNKANRKWRKKHPNQHKSYGEKRERDDKKELDEELLALEEAEEIADIQKIK